MHAVQNIAGYKFAALGNLKALRTRLAERCKSSGLKGTILLAAEGINLFVAGEADSVDRLLAELRSIPGLDDLRVKMCIQVRGEDFVDHLRHNRIDVDLLRSERRRDAEASAREVHEIVHEA